MATVAGGGLSREPGEMWNIPLLDATLLDAGGYVLTYKVEDSANKVDKAASTDIPCAVNYRSTRDPFDLRETNHGDLTGAQIGEVGIPVFADGWARIKVTIDNAAITRGDYLVVGADAGKVDLFTPTTLDTDYDIAKANARLKELAQIVGRAEEDIAVGTTLIPGKDKVLTRLTIGNVGK